MKSWCEQIKLPSPLRDARVPAPTPVMTSGAGAAPEQWQSSYELGRLEGEKSLAEQLVKQRAEMHELFQGALASLRQAVPQVVRDTESMVVSLALEIAMKLVGELPVTVPMVEAAVRDALAEVEGAAQLTVKLHPADLELLQSGNSSLIAPPEGASDITFVASPEVTRGGCLVQTRFGIVDARRETKLDLIKRSLLS